MKLMVYSGIIVIKVICLQVATMTELSHLHNSVFVYFDCYNFQYFRPVIPLSLIVSLILYLYYHHHSRGSLLSYL